MKSVIKLIVSSFFCLGVLMAGAQPAYAGCMDDASDAVFGFLTAGASVAACELQELVQAIEGFIKTVSQLASNVASNAQAVANAAVGAVNSAANDVAGAVSGAQQDLGKAVAEANTMTSRVALSPVHTLPYAEASGTPASRAGAATAQRVAIPAATQGGGKAGFDPRVATAPMQLPADPQRLHAALMRGVQELGALKTSVDQDAGGRIGAALQQARNQATSHLSDAGDIVKTALLAPINALLSMLNDLVSHPTKLLDPIDTINSMVNDISNNIVGTMNHINDVITKDALATLGSVEPNVQAVQGEAQAGDKLLDAMRRADQQKTQVALDALETQLNALASQGRNLQLSSIALAPNVSQFRFAPVRSKLQSTLLNSVAPSQTIAANLKNSWAMIQTRHVAARPRALDPRGVQTAQNELDRVFRGKSPADIERAKQDLLNRARMKFGSNPQLMASIEQNLSGYVQTHVTPAALSIRPAGAPTASQQMSAPRPLAPRAGVGIRPATRN